MKQGQRHNVVNRYTVSTLIVLILAVLAFVVLSTRDNSVASSAPQEVSSTKPTESMFSFIGASGWRQGPTNETSMALFHGHDCFTSVEYKIGTVDVTAELDKIQSNLKSMDYVSESTATLTTTLRFGAGQEQYQLHQYSVTGTGSAGPVKGGQEFGYLQLTNGYLKIEGYCDTVGQLPVTIPALQAIIYTPTD